ncbi:hypothetical protein NC651_019323 [Populus alba x Populus x berolinensis]|nr:hypothetical protein NC651_019323 [Populus alba x Populus x berolinensis]
MSVVWVVSLGKVGLSEVLFIHRYSGGVDVESLTPITLSYFTSSVFVIYAQHLAQGLPEPAVDLKYPGIVLFLIGIIGNFYHHRLLSKLRSNNDKEYKVPKGGLFDLVICPHYLFEILAILGISLHSSNIVCLFFLHWINSLPDGEELCHEEMVPFKVQRFSRDVKALIPFEERQLKINAIFIVDGDGNLTVDSLPGDGRSWLVKNCNGS